MTDETFYIGPWRVHPHTHRIEGGGETYRVTPKVMEVLTVLAQHPGDVIERDTFLDTVWEGTVVTDSVLSRAISELRKIFDDDPTHPTVIETIPKRGYRLIAPVSTQPPNAEPRDDATESPALTSAVLSASPTTVKPWIAAALIAATVLGFVLLTPGRWFSSSTPPALRSATPVPLTSFPGQERDPAFSPDGNRVAFAWKSDTSASFDLYVKLVDHEQPLRLTRTSAQERSPAWSPDGQRIAFLRYTDDGCALFTISALGGAPRRHTTCGDEQHPGLSWSPDGTWLAFSERTDEAPAHITLFAPETQEQRVLTYPPDHVSRDHLPAFSPDGQTVAFIRSLNGWVGHIYLVPTAGGKATPLTTASLDLASLAWTDRQHLVFSVAQGLDAGLWQIARFGGSPHRLYTGSSLLGHLAAAPERLDLAFEHWTYNTDLWRIPLNAPAPASGPKRLTSSTRRDTHPSISPDGERIAFVSTRSGHFEVWTIQREGSHLNPITSFDGPFVGTPRWAPDGRWLVFEARPDGHADLFVVNLEEKTPRRLTNHASGNMMPSWSPDGETIYFASKRSGRWEIWSMPAEGGSATQQTQQGGFYAASSPDGQFLYYAKPDTAGLWRMPLPSGDEERILDALSPEHWSAWSVRDQGLFFVDASSDTTRLALYDPDTQTMRPLVPLPDLGGRPGLSVSPDGTWAVYARTEHSESDLMLLRYADK